MGKKSIITVIKEAFSANESDKEETKIFEVKPNVWGGSGRATQMQVRNLMQMRTFNKP